MAKEEVKKNPEFSATPKKHPAPYVKGDGAGTCQKAKPTYGYNVSTTANKWHGTRQKEWNKSSDRDWPNISMGLIKAAPAMAFEHDSNKDSQRLRILISLTTWAIWKCRNKSTTNNEEISIIDAKETLKNLVTDLVRRSWNATKHMEKRRREM